MYRGKTPTPPKFRDLRWNLTQSYYKNVLFVDIEPSAYYEVVFLEIGSLPHSLSKSLNCLKFISFDVFFSYLLMFLNLTQFFFVLLGVLTNRKKKGAEMRLLCIIDAMSRSVKRRGLHHNWNRAWAYLMARRSRDKLLSEVDRGANSGHGDIADIWETLDSRFKF